MAIKVMGPLKAPGPDGFNAGFYQQMWEVVGHSLTQATIRILEGDEFDKDLAKAFMVLIPKIQTPMTVKHFRPISLCNVSFKVVNKVLVNRLKQLLPAVVSPTQSSFIPGRHITDNIVVCQEMIHTLRNKRGKHGEMILKVDLEKAYDRLEWQFIRETLVDVGLPSTMIEVIMHCVTAASFSLLWNGDSTDTIEQTRGASTG